MIAASLLLALLGQGVTKIKLDPWSAFPGDSAVSVASEHVHDPTVVRIQGRWFVFSTSGDGFCVVRSSADLKTWRVHGAIAMERPTWLAGRYKHRSIWAPDILVVGGTIRLYYCASDFGTNRSVIGLAENSRFDPARPTEGWTDRGLVFESKPGDAPNAIDPETFIDAGGRHRLVFGSYFGGIYGLELDPRTGLLLNPEKAAPALLAINTEPGNPLEGAAVCYRDGFYYLFVSYGLAAQGVRSTYRVMVGRSKSPTGPFLDANGKSMAQGGHVDVLKSSPPMFSPGHSDVLQTPDGRWLMPYHFYDSRSYWGGGKWGLPRLQIRELLWSDDGWPLPGLPVEFPRAGGASLRPMPGVWTLQTDFGEPSEARVTSDGSVTFGGTKTRPTLQGGDWTVQIPGIAAPISLRLAYGGTYATGRTADGRVVRLARTSR